MSHEKKTGEEGEERACKFLQDKGFVILARNFYYGHAEIDVIAGLGNTVVFTEVKKRNSRFLDDPAHLVSRSKQQQMIRAADHYMKVNEPDKEYRFDILLIISGPAGEEIEHIEDAFYPMS